MCPRPPHFLSASYAPAITSLNLSVLGSTCVHVNVRSMKENSLKNRVGYHIFLTFLIFLKSSRTAVAYMSCVWDICRSSKLHPTGRFDQKNISEKKKLPLVIYNRLNIYILIHIQNYLMLSFWSTKIGHFSRFIDWFGADWLGTI